MPWGFAIAAAGTMYSANKADKANRRGMNAAMSAAELERETALDTLNYYKERDAQSFAMQGQVNAIAGKVANAQVGLMNQQRQQSDEYFKRLKSVFWPLEDGLVKDAQEYDTAERRESEAGKAVADVETMLSGERQAMTRASQRMGVNPNSGNAQAMENQMSLGAASAKAGAATGARDKVEQQGWARRYDAAALGRNLPSNSSTAASVATSAGNSAVNAAYAPVNAFNNATDRMGGAMAGYAGVAGNAGRLLAGQYQNQADSWGQAAAGFGQLAGNAMGAMYANKTSAPATPVNDPYMR
jgi:hypothetical protein